MDRPADGSKFGERGEIVDADFLVGLLDTFRFGNYNLPAIKNVLNAPAKVTSATEQQDKTTEKQDDGSQGLVGDASVRESIGSVSSSSDPVILDDMSETGSNNVPVSNEETGSPNEPVSNEESGYNWLESNSTNLPSVENERHHNEDEGEIVEEEKEKEKDKEEEEEEKDENKNSERTSSDSEEKSNLETLLAIQEKYELYCPSCSSCITRKVILRKKEHGKLVDESSDIEEIEPHVKVHTPKKLITENEDQEYKEEGYLFACLACLKYYIRLGTRFLRRDDEPVEVLLESRESSNTTESESPPQNKLDRERFLVELLKSTVYGGLTETITSLVVVSSASASGSSTENILALAVANLAGGLIVLAQNLQDLRNSSDQEKDRYNELLGRRDNIRLHVLVVVLSYIFFGLIAPLVYALPFYQTGIKNYKLVSGFSVSLVCAIMLGMIKVYVRKPINVRPSPKPYLKSAAYYTSIVVVSSGISYIVGEIVGEYIRKLGLFSLYQTGLTSTLDGIKPEEYRFTSF
ncbi:PREDICTED: membrane protein of ER body 2 isoform X1 [Brassica oleracea var. oleracea]|uniref:Membrane protein of ER body-like protein n=2 Tax=Brassica oleracea var. oleracea TaxID=109376 RepID=A0A0D3DD52_BRAOL|nr:PREDICTED: membrane protein of ER body 2 isoform X1 [Brassica oleracea var. oleracea]